MDKPLTRADAEGARDLMSRVDVRALLAAMAREPIKVRHFRQPALNPCAVGIPNRARRSIAVVPAGLLKRHEKPLLVGSQAMLELAIAALNTHAAYTWWLEFGNGRTVSAYVLGCVAIPSQWIREDDVNRRVRELARELIAAVKPDNIHVAAAGVGGKPVEFVDFHECAPDVVERLDTCYIIGLIVGEYLSRQENFALTHGHGLGAGNELSVMPDGVLGTMRIIRETRELQSPRAGTAALDRFLRDFEPRTSHFN